MSIQHKALDAIKLSYHLGIPIAVCYRRLRELEHLGLIEEVGKKLTQKGKWIRLYKSKLKNAEIYMIDNKVKVKISFRGGNSNEFDLFSGGEEE
jgi:predicted transcriptional regulator